MKPVDTTGAGDAFVSGLLNSLASDLTLLTVLISFLLPCLDFFELKKTGINEFGEHFFCRMRRN